MDPSRLRGSTSLDSLNNCSVLVSRGVYGIANGNAKGKNKINTEMKVLMFGEAVCQVLEF